MPPHRCLVCAALALLSSITAAEHLPRGFPTRRGPLVFVPTSTLVDPDRETLRWLSRFDLILTNGYDLAPAQTRLPLQRAGSRLFLYLWSNGFTETEARAQLPQSPWWREVLEQHPAWLLNREPLEGPPGTPPSYYLDLAQATCRDWLGRRMAEWRAQTGYDGVFFDLAGSTALPQHAWSLWQAAHPDVPYDAAFLELLRTVRELDPKALLIANQAYHTLTEALRLVDYDLTESYGTSYLWGPEKNVAGEALAETFIRPWAGVAGLEARYGGVETALAKAAPRRDFIYLDYMRSRFTQAAAQSWQPELDVEAVYYSFVAAKLWGHESFCSGWYAKHEYRGPLYFADLGQPLGRRPRETGGLVMREYERGLVVLLARPEAAETELQLRTSTARLYDLFSGQTEAVSHGRVRLSLAPCRSPLTDTVNPIGRVFLKITH